MGTRRSAAPRTGGKHEDEAGKERVLGYGTLTLCRERGRQQERNGIGPSSMACLYVTLFLCLFLSSASRFLLLTRGLLDETISCPGGINVGLGWASLVWNKNRTITIIKCACLCHSNSRGRR